MGRKKQKREDRSEKQVKKVLLGLTIGLLALAIGLMVWSIVG